MRVNFYLKKPEPTSGRSLIYLQAKYSGHKLVFSFRQSIEPKNWNAAKQRVKSNNQTTEDGKYSLNDLLDNLEKVCVTTYNNEVRNGIPHPAVIKAKLEAFMKREAGDNTLYNVFERFINGEIQYRGRARVHNTTKSYRTVLNHLKAFESAMNYPLSFNTITREFYNKYMAYLEAKGLSTNTKAIHIQVIKSAMNEAVDLGYTSNYEFRNRKFSAPWQETDAVYLTDRELQAIHKHDLSSNKRLDQVRDLFLVGCATGLRFSDLSELKAENIIEIEGERFIRVRTKKTNEVVIIPCSPMVIQILNKYAANANSLPRSLSNQKFNDYIKEVLRAVGLTEKGRLMSEPERELCDCVSSHTGRRSFATNLYLEGFPTIEIMKITGHKTEKAFLKYIRVSKLDSAKRLGKHIQVKWSEKLLKAVG